MSGLNLKMIKKTVLDAFIKIVNEINRKPSKLWVNQRREFSNKLMQEWLDNNDVLMYFTYNEGKSVKSINKYQLIIANFTLVI